ncbi:ATP-binding protein [Candidatus Gracilibacteria bacterium]|nr:ATP-binding protein [Candidatus Gracilibacteria bacterium]
MDIPDIDLLERYELEQEALANKNALEAKQTLRQNLPEILKNMEFLKDFLLQENLSLGKLTASMKDIRERASYCSEQMDLVSKLSETDIIRRSRGHDIHGILPHLGALGSELFTAEDFFSILDNLQKSIPLLYYWAKSLKFILDPEYTHNRPISLQTFVRDIQSCFEGTYSFNRKKDSYEIQVEFQQITNSEDVTLDIDDGSLAMIILNCIRNAAVHGEADKISIGIKDTDDYVGVVIADNGKGITAFPEGKVNDILYSGISSTGDSDRGIGLSDVTKKLAHFNATIDILPHGGFSRNGTTPPNEHGAVFRIRIPLKKKTTVTTRQIQQDISKVIKPLAHSEILNKFSQAKSSIEKIMFSTDLSLEKLETGQGNLIRNSSRKISNIIKIIKESYPEQQASFPDTTLKSFEFIENLSNMPDSNIWDIYKELSAHNLNLYKTSEHLKEIERTISKNITRLSLS